MFNLEQEKLTKITFFVGYNYHLRFFNIKRKIDDLEKNASKLQRIVTKNFDPIIFKGGEIQKESKKIFEVKKLKVKLKSEPIKNYSHSKQFTSNPYTEECKYYLMVDILSETTQYAADLASIIIGLKDFKTEKSTFSQIEDAKIKRWYQDLKKPSIKDFAKILNIRPLNELSIEERFIVCLRYDQFLWNLKKVGNFYWYNYIYLYTPFRHGMKGSFWRDSMNRVFCRTLTRDKKYNFYYLSDNIIKECQEISELIFAIFIDDLAVILLSKGITPFITNLRFKVINSPKLPIKSFNTKEMKNKFVGLDNIKIHHFTVDDFASIHKFASIPNNNISFKYKKMNIGTSIFNLDNKDYYLDSFFSFSKRLKEDKYIIICNCPLAYFIELTYISIISNKTYDFMMSQIKHSIFHYLSVEINLDYILKDPSKTIHRTNQINALTDEILKEFILLIGLHLNKKYFESFHFLDEEIEIFIYLQKQRMIRLLNMKNYMKKLYPDIILQILISLLAISYFEANPMELFSKELQIKNINSFLEKLNDLIKNSVKNDIDFEKLLEIMNCFYDFINRLK